MKESKQEKRKRNRKGEKDQRLWKCSGSKTWEETMSGAQQGCLQEQVLIWSAQRPAEVISTPPKPCPRFCCPHVSGCPHKEQHEGEVSGLGQGPSQEGTHSICTCVLQVISTVHNSPALSQIAQLLICTATPNLLCLWFPCFS